MEQELKGKQSCLTRGVTDTVTGQEEFSGGKDLQGDLLS